MLQDMESELIHGKGSTQHKKLILMGMKLELYNLLIKKHKFLDTKILRINKLK